jgi:hypothetical protein
MATSTNSSTRERTSTDTWLVVASTLLLSGLAIADRTVAWMLGEFPTSAGLWELRFEYLRPIGVFHDIAVQSLGDVGVGPFNIAAGLAALIVAVGALSGIRLARALSNHALLAAALVVTVYSVDPGEGIYAPVGMPSDGYLLIGLLLTVGAAFLCASSHCEYIGWSPASSGVVRRVRTELVRRGLQIGDWAAEGLEQAFPVAGKAQAIVVRARRRSSSRSFIAGSSFDS